MSASPRPTTPALKVAALQFLPTLYDKEGNTRRLLDLLSQAFSAGARIAVAPEMATTGYCFYDRADVSGLVETLPGPTTGLVQAVCAVHDSVAVLGLPEVDAATGIYYNSIAVVGPQGLIGKYRKVHSFIAEPRWAMDGDLGHVVVQTPHGAIGLLDCADIELFEGARVLQILGADLIAFPTNWCGGPAPSYYWWARAWELGLPLIAADRIGTERGVAFSGGSTIFAADGTVLATRDDGEGIVLAEIEKGSPGTRKAPLPPRDCIPLARDTHRFNPEAFFNLYAHPSLPQGGELRVSALPLRGSLRGLVRNLRGVRDQVVVLPADALEGAWDAESTNEAVRVCRAQGIYLAFGSASTGDLALVGPEGLLALRRPQDRGTERAIVNLPGVRVGLCRGEELAWPETSRLFAMEGVDLLLTPDRGLGFAPGRFAGSTVRSERGPAPADDCYYFIPRVRAASDDLFVAYASAELPCAVFSAAKGRGEASLQGAEGIVDTRPTLRGLPDVRLKPHLRRRRPEHYRPLWTPQ
ncbi:MAG: hypothetical protein M0Z66_15055 [Thermaerobacter sp.]|nr:hypothetical protein [Thermaerobacter sp.]